LILKLLFLFLYVIITKIAMDIRYHWKWW